MLLSQELGGMQGGDIGLLLFRRLVRGLFDLCIGWCYLVMKLGA